MLPVIRYVFVTLAVASVLGASVPASARDDVEARFREAGDLRSRGQFDEAIEVLTGVIEESRSSDALSRRAYNQLVWTLAAKSDDLSERIRLSSDPARKQALQKEVDAVASRIGEMVGAALTRFPDIRAGDDVPDPSRVNQMYEPARQRMFGNLVIDSEPDSAAVWIHDEGGDWTRMGFTPLRRNLYPIGSYEIRLAKQGHKEIDVTSRVGPNETTRHDVTLPRSRDATWWVTRVGVPAAGLVGLTAYLLLSGDDGGTAEPDPLPLPPDPPSR